MKVYTKTKVILFAIWVLFCIVALTNCGKSEGANGKKEIVMSDSMIVPLKPQYVTDPVTFDSDDPAIWINQNDPSKSLIIGTDKGGEKGEGGLFVFDLEGNLDTTRSVRGIQRPNNVDIAYGFNLNGQIVDIAVTTERLTNKLRVFSLPEMKEIDNGGIYVFEGDSIKDPMGIALYTDPITKDIYAIVGRKYGPENEYLWQYKLVPNEKGYVEGELVRKFGKFSGVKEIEAIAVDSELGYVYYSDENVGVRKYYAHPDSSDTQIALFATNDIKEDHEGISIYKRENGTGYLILSDQQAGRFAIYPREGSEEDPDHHQLICYIPTSTVESDGNEVTSISLNPEFKKGLFVAMSDDKTFQIYNWNHIQSLIDRAILEKLNVQ
ncbi:phytase [Marinigracilibium pacificum]|uniref:Phytase n=1 Tax=Marinigracilibium pacificum TaxID=2729599 RepID=A0A848IY11_9BACT|nr:phytase [Marinigracilibium pacificum]NMM48058.1 phytase [Marinigracilibium pacificum]